MNCSSGSIGSRARFGAAGSARQRWRRDEVAGSPDAGGPVRPEPRLLPQEGQAVPRRASGAPRSTARQSVSWSAANGLPAWTRSSSWRAPLASHRMNFSTGWAGIQAAPSSVALSSSPDSDPCKGRESNLLGGYGSQTSSPIDRAIRVEPQPQRRPDIWGARYVGLSRVDLPLGFGGRGRRRPQIGSGDCDLLRGLMRPVLCFPLGSTFRPCSYSRSASGRAP